MASLDSRPADQPASVLSRSVLTKKSTEAKSWIHLHVKKNLELKSLSAEWRRPDRSQPSKSGNRQRAEVCALNSNDRTGVPGEQLGGFCEQMQPPGE